MLQFGAVQIFFLFGEELTLSQTTNLNCSKLKEFADDNFKFYENGRNLSKLVENTEGTKKVALYDQLLLSPQCFQKTYKANT